MRVKNKRTHNPPTIGPRTGPVKTQAVKRVVAGPRPTAGQISAMTPDDTLKGKENAQKIKYLPPATVGGATAKKPEKRRVTINVSILGASACPRINKV